MPTVQGFMDDTAELENEVTSFVKEPATGVGASSTTRMVAPEQQNISKVMRVAIPDPRQENVGPDNKMTQVVGANNKMTQIVGANNKMTQAVAMRGMDGYQYRQIRNNRRRLIIGAVVMLCIVIAVLVWLAVWFSEPASVPFAD